MKVTTIITLLFLSSCAFFSHQRNVDTEIKDFFQNKKSLIILKLSSSYPNVEWCAYRESENDENINCITIKSGANYQILLVQPGKYEIASYDKISYRYRFSHHKIEPRFSNITHKRRDKPIFIFEALPLKINYLGNIKFNDYSVGSDRVTDEFDDLQKYLNVDDYQITQKYNEIIIKNLAKTKLDLSEENKLKKDLEKSYKKKLKELAKKKKNPKSSKDAKLKNYEN